ncbi:uncharacterized protein L969DRAFT_83759 [Mixia osmundae IAM 14324]|uniref:DOMON domain-containing protein n=1 Tax=Mixia osmundae (strain CBS 9802 / IAM 14324 / JCM 22182 / KY 12970) TaxID=764103 RepID=G7E796_MIXOS|nr:uncharacterized protein L969DRAFT_83759 [Mixia osmundae IAM 14324]KEI41900.1 hypothetical protein L969DRAFT_83759 [Mixia osmundae IAM 14324]GAA98706.1 hypothetical protein E5Q_05394 [Mixia osmundae IAM 14324]
MRQLKRLSKVLTTLLLPLSSHAYQVLITDEDVSRQTCSGMYAKAGLFTRGVRDPAIEVVFGASSMGQVALVIYEWRDARYLGASQASSANNTLDAADGLDPDELNDRAATGDNDGSASLDSPGALTLRALTDEPAQRTYICTGAANAAGLCEESQLGQFIVSAPANTSTSIYTRAVQFGGMISNSGPFIYNITKTGFYCVGTVPLSSSSAPAAGYQDAPASDEPADLALRASYGPATVFTGVVDFQNVFKGNLPASEYPKVAFYCVLTFLYSFVGIGWGALCVKNRRDLLPIQHYVSGTIVFLIFEMFVLWSYTAYLNTSSNIAVARFLLVFVAMVNAARNSASFFLLLITCMGFSVVKPSLGPVMNKARILAVIHFIFGVLYSVGTVVIPLESAGIFIFFFIIPLALSLTAFMMWIMYSLNSTIADLTARKQTFKKLMFTRLYRILIGAIIVIASFFVISSVSFSSRLDDNYAPDTWQTRWFLLDGWLGSLYFIVFAAIAFVWRPTPKNRLLAMSEELAQDDDGAESYAVTSLLRNRPDDRDAESIGKDAEAHSLVRNDETVFDIGEEDLSDSDEASSGRHKDRPPSYQDRDHQV